MFDNICKFLAETFPSDFATWLLGASLPLTQLSPSELSLEPIRADALILLQSEQMVLHLEFQTLPKPEIPFRMADYRLRAYRRFPAKQMRQVVIYLQPSRSELAQQTTFILERTRHEFEVIRLWEQPTEIFLQSPGLLPLAVLSQAEDRTRVLRQVAQAIERLPDPRTQSHVSASTAVLAGLVLEKMLIQQVLRRELMQESVIYQSILAEGWEKGCQEGREVGRQEGRHEAKQLEISLILRQLQRRIGPTPAELQEQIQVLSFAQLEELGEALLDFTEVTELANWLADH